MWQNKPWCVSQLCWTAWKHMLSSRTCCTTTPFCSWVITQFICLDRHLLLRATSSHLFCRLHSFLGNVGDHYQNSLHEERMIPCSAKTKLVLFDKCEYPKGGFFPYWCSDCVCVCRRLEEHPVQSVPMSRIPPAAGIENLSAGSTPAPCMIEEIIVRLMALWQERAACNFTEWFTAEINRGSSLVVAHYVSPEPNADVLLCSNSPSTPARWLPLGSS